MEAFKEYLKKEYPHIDTGDEMFAWDIWRAAMEYMLTVSDNKCCFVDCIVHKAIEKELEDASEN